MVLLKSDKKINTIIRKNFKKNPTIITCEKKEWKNDQFSAN
jgi:hypothetical protein